MQRDEAVAAGQRPGCLPAAARHAAAREAAELARHDTIQYLAELKAASSERSEQRKRERKERRWGKLRGLVLPSSDQAKLKFTTG